MRTTLLILVTLLFNVFVCNSQTLLEPKYIVGPTIPSAVGLVVDDSGNLYVANHNQVRVIDSEGNFIKDITLSDVPFNGQANAIAKDADNNLYVWNEYNALLHKFNPNGDLIHKFKAKNNAFTSSYVSGVAVAPDGSIYIADVHQQVVRKYTNEGQYLLEITSLNMPTDVAVGSDGSVYIADSKNKRIAKYTENGEFIIAFSSAGGSSSAFIRPTGVEVNEYGRLYVADAGAATLYTFDQNGVSGMKLPLTNISANAHLGIATDNSGNIYVSTYSFYFEPQKNGRIIKILPTGYAEKQFGSTDPPYEELSVTALETDREGHYFYAANALSKKVQIYNRQGVKLHEFTPKAIEPDKNIILDIAASPDGNLFIMDNQSKGTVKIYTPTGIFKSNFDDLPNHMISGAHRYKLTAGLDQFFYVLGEGYIYKYNNSGKFLGTVTLSDKHLSLPIPVYQDLAVDESGNLYLIIIDDQTNSLNTVYRVQKYDKLGNYLLSFSTRGRFILEINIPKSIEVDLKGNVYVAGNSVEVFKTDGTLVGYVPVSADEISVSAEGSTMLSAMHAKGQIIVLGNQSDGQESFITGIVYHDENGNNVLDSNETKLKNIAIRAEPGSLFGFSDAEGHYKIPVEDVGVYEVAEIVPLGKEGLDIKQTFPSGNQPYTVTITNKRSTVTGINFANQVTLSPYLSVSVSSTRRRRCFDSTTKLTYTNTGFAPANNAKVYFQLPKEVELLSADKPYTHLPNGTYVFDAGTVNPGQTSVITIQDKVVCGDESIRGLTVCTKAWITPGNNGPATPTTVVATVSGKCDFEKGMVRFVIRNTGQADMDARKVFKLYLDGQLSTVEEYKLAAGDSLVLWIPNGGKTARLEAEQPGGNGDNTLASATIEACIRTGTPAPVPFSTGFVNAMPTDDEEAEVSEECLPIIDSFDPNDKLVSPIGLTDENYTPTGTALKYKIRFQNTGTDVAYRVVVVDTLSEHLDLSTLQLGTTSHTARFDVSGKGKPVLTWTFDNIMLPDSTTNEPGSHGYIQFSIKPKADLAEKTAVENFADIFFDFNSPVRTNTTLNRIYDMPPVVVDAVKLNAEEIIATPTISSFAPAAGKYGTEVILSGSKFSPAATNNKVYFNGVPATVLSATDTELKVLVPSSATASGSLKVETRDGAATTTETFEVYQPPLLSSFSPAEGVAGSVVSIQGQQLDPNLIQSIKLGNYTCEVLSNTANALVVKIPAQAVTGSFVVQTKGGEAASATSYVVWHQPAISSLSKATDIVGATLQINGENFAPAAARNIVQFGQTQAQVLTATAIQLTVKVPQGAASGYVTVETPGGKATSATYFDVIPGPVFETMVPAKGSVGTTVEITGDYFLTLGVQDEITFNGEKAIVLEASETKYKVQVPRGATTGKIKIKGVGGEALSTTDFVVEALTPAQSIAVFPNPTSGKFTISFLHADFDVQDVRVYSSVGELVHTAALNKPRPEKLEVDMETAKPGMYLLQIRTDRGIVIKKLSVL